MITLIDGIKLRLLYTHVRVLTIHQTLFEERGTEKKIALGDIAVREEPLSSQSWNGEAGGHQGQIPENGGIHYR